MTIAIEERNRKADWLTSPIEWALYIGALAVVVLALMFWNGDVGTDTMLAIAFSALAAVTGLLIWGHLRIGRVISGH